MAAQINSSSIRNTELRAWETAHRHATPIMYEVYARFCCAIGKQNPRNERQMSQHEFGVGCRCMLTTQNAFVRLV